jgi:DNA end-binding protein Ku
VVTRNPVYPWLPRKDYLKLSLVSASIAIYPATSTTEKVRFNTLNRETGNRLKRQMVDAVSGEVVESEEQVKGYAIAKDQYVVVEDDELANIAIESKSIACSRPTI